MGGNKDPRVRANAGDSRLRRIFDLAEPRNDIVRGVAMARTEVYQPFERRCKTWLTF